MSSLPDPTLGAGEGVGLTVHPHRTSWEAPLESTRSLVSVIIPCYKLAHYLPTAIDSALAQTYTPLEVVVVNDGSPDETAEVMARYADDPRVMSLTQENAGVAAARNMGIAHAHGAYLQFLDADDWLHPEKIARQVALLDAEPDVGLVYCGFSEVCGDHVVPYELTWDARWPAEPEIFDTLWAENRVMLPAVLLRREWVERVGEFHTGALTEDYEFWLRLAARGCRVRYVPKHLVYYRRHDTNRSKDGRALARRTAARAAVAEAFPKQVAAATERAFAIWGSIWSELRGWAEELQAQVAERDGRLDDQRQRTDALEAQLADVRGWAERQRQVIEEQNSHVDALEEQLADVRDWAQHQTEVVERLSKQLAEAECQTARVSSRLARVEQHPVYRMYRILRRIRRVIIP